MVGAGRTLGRAVALELRAAGHAVTATLRRPDPRSEAALREAHCALAYADLERPETLNAAAGFDAAVLTPILSLSARAIPTLEAAAIPRTVFFSSNNVALTPDDPTYARLLAGEAQVRASRLAATIVRPTLIYGQDRACPLAALMRLSRRFPLLPLPGRGQALQQPVQVGDLARAAAGLAADSALAGETVAIGGPDVVRLAELYAMTARAAGARTRFFPTPLALLQPIAAAAATLGLDFPLKPAQLKRADLDKTAGAGPALPAGLAPRTALAQGLAALAAALGLKPA